MNKILLAILTSISILQIHGNATTTSNNSPSEEQNAPEAQNNANNATGGVAGLNTTTQTIATQTGINATGGVAGLNTTTQTVATQTGINATGGSAGLNTKIQTVAAKTGINATGGVAGLNTTTETTAAKTGIKATGGVAGLKQLVNRQTSESPNKSEISTTRSTQSTTKVKSVPQDQHNRQLANNPQAIDKSMQQHIAANQQTPVIPVQASSTSAA